MSAKITPKLWLSAFLAWLVPLVISFFLFNPQTREYIPNFLSFKVIMAVVLLAITWFLYMRLRNEMKSSKWQVSIVFLLVSVVFDLIVLVWLLAMPFATWLLTVLPLYIVIFFGIEWWMQNNHLDKKKTK